MLKAVTVDLWQTLIMETPEGSRWTRAERIRGISDVLRKQRIASDPEQVDKAYGLLGGQLETLWKTNRDADARGQVEMLLDNLPIGVHAPYADALLKPLIDAYTLPILSAMPLALDGAPGLLSALEARGLRMAVICNSGRTPGSILRIILDRLGLARYLSVQTFSNEFGLRKPRTEIFQHTLEALGVTPQEALHVGDSLASDIAGAQATGMRAVHLCHAGGANPNRGSGETISSLPELLPIVDSSLR
jgi:putative hydrolase of the HAD superfamily